MTAELLGLVMGELFLPFAGWIAGLGLGSLLVGFVLHRMSRRKLAAPPRTSGRSLALAVIALVTLGAVPFGVTLLSLPFVAQRAVAGLLETRAPELIAWTADRGETLWLARTGVRADALLPPVSELRERFADRGDRADEEPARAALSILRIGDLASERFRSVVVGALDVVAASGAETWGEAMVAVRPTVEARLAEEARSLAIGFRAGSWMHLLPAAAVALLGWMFAVVLAAVMPAAPAAAPGAPGVPPHPDSDDPPTAL